MVKTGGPQINTWPQNAQNHPQLHPGIIFHSQTSGWSGKEVLWQKERIYVTANDADCPQLAVFRV
eukprot:1158860-Pelagomonas_calceolata.AAC.1